MEIGVRVEAEHLTTGTVRHTASAYLTFVALGEDRRPTVIPKIIPDTGTDKKRYEDASKRKRLRLDAG